MNELPVPHTEPPEGVYPRVPDFLEHWSPRMFVRTAAVSGVVLLVIGLLWWPFWLLLVPWAALAWRGWADMNQTHHAILRNYPLLGHLRYLLESIRPEIQQYFVESSSDGRPFDREDRTVVYQRAKNAPDTVPFGTRDDYYALGAEWLRHSLYPTAAADVAHSVLVGGPQCTQPYALSLLNVSAMSYGSLSRNAIMALNQGARMGGFAHNTGEGGIAPHHLQGGDLVWQVGTGYFGCRTLEGEFDREKFRENAARDSVKMIELKLSQGAKPAHGGILPAAKVTPEIARIRGVVVGEDVLSPPAHTAFEGPRGLIRFIQELRELADGKPVGFKICVGQPAEFMAVVHAMIDLDITPDFITVDGAEGGTGAAPMEFSDRVGTPLDEGLAFVHDTLRGAGLRDRIRLISAGKIATGFHMVRQMALGADACNSARAMMFSLGCIQALKCNTNHCPTGIATQDAELMKGLNVSNKALRVQAFQAKTVHAALELIGAAGLTSAEELRRHHVVRRCSTAGVKDLSELYPRCTEGSLLDGTAPVDLLEQWHRARRQADRWQARAST